MKIVETADIIVIGGGIIGCSLAYQLSLAGASVIVLETRSIASGASARNGGQVLQLEGRDSNPGSILTRLKYTQYGNQLLERFSEALGADIEYRRCGSLDLALAAPEAQQLQRLVEIHHQCGDNRRTSDFHYYPNRQRKYHRRRTWNPSKKERTPLRGRRRIRRSTGKYRDNWPIISYPQQGEPYTLVGRNNDYHRRWFTLILLILGDFATRK